MTAYKPKLIEVALPLAAINAESAREKSIRHGHPATLHLWWARRPLAAARAVLWSSLVDDPSGDPNLTHEEQEEERRRLFEILERLVKWESSNNPEVLAEATAEIARCFPEGLPPVLDPFGGGGAIPLEAQRLGLKALSGDLNPVSVLIQKSMTEVPSRFANRGPVHPQVEANLNSWERAQGLAADVEAYGLWMRDEAKRRIGDLYPDATGSSGEKLTPIAWIWARTVESPDPTWRGHVPLVASWNLLAKPGKSKIWIEPVIDRDAQDISYVVRHGGEPLYDRTVTGGTGVCLATGAAIPPAYIKAEAMAGRMGHRLMAVVAEGSQGRTYLSTSDADEAAALGAVPKWRPEGALPAKGLGFRVQAYGIDQWSMLFTERQLVALTTFSDLLDEAGKRVVHDAVERGFAPDGTRLRDGGAGAQAYADAVVTYLSFTLDKCRNLWSNLVSWMSDRGAIREVFARQAISMVWDFAEVAPFSGRGGSWEMCLDKVQMAIGALPASSSGSVVQRDARARVRECPNVVISSDPPYYDNVGYADLSDFFYTWLRNDLGEVWPDECATLLTPKASEMIADPARHGGALGAAEYFEHSMAEFMLEVSRSQTVAAPATLYYAYKATETRDGAKRSTGWDTFLQALLDSGLQVNATWPIRTESPGRIRAIGSNALASSIVLVCRSRDIAAPLASRGEFIAALRDELPEAVRLLQSGNIAPVDIAQSTIGPGIKVFSRYAKVVESDGSAMSVSTALGIINDVLGEVLDGEDAELDADTRFAVSWYAQHGFENKKGDADGQARAKNTSLAGIEASGIGEARGGFFRLFQRTELDPFWSPTNDTRLTVWEATQHLVAALDRSESEAAQLLRQLGGYGDSARQLAYLLFQKATDKGWADEAGSYNGLITAWPALAGAAVRDEEEDGQGRML